MQCFICVFDYFRLLQPFLRLHLADCVVVFAAWSLVSPVLRQLAEKEIGTPVDLPDDFMRISRQADPALAHLHHHGVLMYDMRNQYVTVWSKVMRDSLREGMQRTSSVAL